MNQFTGHSEQLSVINKQLKGNYFSLSGFIRVVLRMEKRILASSSASLNKLSNAFSLINSVSLRRFNQYFVSRDSLYAIEIFAEKSAFEIAPFASEIFAPTLVPLLSNCLERINSFLSLLRNWYTFTTLTANKYAFSYKLFFIFLPYKFSSKTNLIRKPYKSENNHCLLFTENCPLICFI